MSKTERGQCMVMCLDCMYLMTERSDEQVTECAACGRDDCLADGIDLAEIVERWNKTNWRDLYAARDLLAACKKMWGFYDDLSTSNPGFMSRMRLRDYAQWNEAMLAMPAAIAKAGA